MMTLAVLQRLAAIGYGTLFIRLAQTRSLYLCPWFGAYCLSLTIYYPMWNASEPAQIRTQMFILGLRFCAGLEALELAMLNIGWREKRLTAYFLAAVMLAAVSGILIQGNWYGAGELAQYRWIHQTVNVSLATACIAALGLFWIDPPKTWGPLRAHGAIFTLLSISHAVSGFMKSWQLASALFFCGSLLCIALWLWKGLLAQGHHQEPV